LPPLTWPQYHSGVKLPVVYQIRGENVAWSQRGTMVADVKRAIRSASILKDGRVVFNLAGNKYRLVVWINYPYRVVYCCPTLSPGCSSLALAIDP
jgi:hypothetical protein